MDSSNFDFTLGGELQDDVEDVELGGLNFERTWEMWGWEQQLYGVWTGTFTADQSDPASTVVRSANYLFENGFGNFHLFKNNYEDFALYCKTGLLKIDNKGVVVGRSGQIANYPPWASKIGMKNVIKVPVEEMDEFHRHLIAGLIPTTLR
ncbi:hypothetical protein RHMOL_Rhmol07G0095800 [Rhododendron molle]|uniref:Uncharacterized protein n=1 Tax=Rhododendron molle TaxID=49168 RepID=A0ACC0N008_RHOML|nr:hypothetical protein RHMOL_Rhmol07G0095800 [Rhododendron molle]